ncbi:ABC-2 family transporter protein [Tyzzerella sp. OttesenSCG-928-J15]|nr:ABC-2 family transporter protein [Tyzzerella sp. OttesenSCG-928-J15]
MEKLKKTLTMSFSEKVSEGIAYLLPEYIIQLMTMTVLMLVWGVLLDKGADVPMSKEQMLTYTFVSFMLRDFIDMRTELSSWNYEGQLINLYLRPMGVFPQVICQTLGKLLPKLLVFSLPLFFIAPLFGINTVPESPLFFLSLALSISAGFAIDFLFACLCIKLMNINWLIITIRRSVTNIFSGAVIPFAMLPFGLDKILPWQPFGVLANAPLSIFVGSQQAAEFIIAQIVWNIVLWPLAVYVWQRSREGLVSFGG